MLVLSSTAALEYAAAGAFQSLTNAEVAATETVALRARSAQQTRNVLLTEFHGFMNPFEACFSAPQIPFDRISRVTTNYWRAQKAQ